MSAFSLTHILLLFGILQALQLSLVLALRAEGNRAAVLCLQALLSVCALLLTDYLMLTTGNALAFPALAGFSIPLAFALGPLLLGYVACQSGSKPRWSWSWHLLPMAACALLLIFSWGTVPSADKHEWLTTLMTTGYSGGQFKPLVASLLLCLQLVVYSYYADVLLERYDNALQQQEAGRTVQLVRWLRLVTRGFCLFQLLFYLSWVEWQTVPVDWHYTALTMSCLAVLLAGAGLWSQLHPELFRQAALAPLPALPDPQPEAKYGRNRLDAVQLTRFLGELDQCMRQHKPYLDPELRLSRLAELVGMTPHLLSQVINEGHGCNYFDYVNRQRVAHAQALLRAGASNMLELALDSGFNSKATFNRSFRQLAGMTPSAWIAANARQEATINS